MEEVTNLKQACDAYLSAKSARERQAAFHEMLLFGGEAPYPHEGRERVARWFRIIALWVDGRG
jgi:hypothetical protein